MHNTKARGAYFIMLLLFLAHIFSSNSSAPPIGRTGAPGEGSCANCHGGSNPQGLDGSLEITGLPAEVMSNTLYRVTVEAANPNGLSLSAGMQMVALNGQNTGAGTFTNPSAGARVRAGNSGKMYLEHNPAQTYDANRIASWSVDWTSPADPDPEVTFYAAGNITDMDSNSNTANDLILFQTVDVEVAGDVMVDLPDLTAGNVVGFEGTYLQGEVAEFNWDLINLGQVAAEDDYRIVMYLSDDQQFSADDVVVGEVPTGNTFPGTISGVPGAITVPTDQLIGEYYLHFFVDNDNTIEESDETNNIFTTSTTITVSVEQTDPLEVNIISMLDCEGFATIESAVFGGVGAYTYAWSTGETTANIVASSSGTYSVTVMDEMQDQVFASVNVIVPEVLTLDAMINQQPGCGQLGDVALLVMGGTPPYDINWSNGSVGTQNGDLPAGNYSITVTDANGCMALAQVVLTDTADLTITVTVTQLTCSDSDDGAISLMTNMGNSGVTFAWSNGATTAIISDLAAGQYTVTATSGSNCEVVRTYTITQINEIELITDLQSVNCFGNMDGQINTLATGGTGPYTYAWSNGETTNNISNLNGGIYTLTVTDANGCRLVTNLEIGEPAELNLDLVSIDVLCPNGDNGSILINQLTGGIPPYTYSWSNGGTTTGIDNLVAGSYTVTVTDANGCEVMRSVIVSEPVEIVISLESFATTENGVCFDASGIVPAPATYMWSNGATTAEICNLDPGSYSVTITDGNGCESTGSGEVISTSVAGISELHSWELYPTLADNMLSIDVQLDQSVSLQLEMANLDGRFMPVPAASFSQIGLQQRATIDVSSLASGIYLLILSTDQGREVKRFVKL